MFLSKNCDTPAGQFQSAVIQFNLFFICIENRFEFIELCGRRKICFCGFAFFLRRCPETKGKSLEELSKELVKE